ncbi:MAG: hypothetical protein ACK55Z_11015, partial [bacterium]
MLAFGGEFLKVSRRWHGLLEARVLPVLINLFTGNLCHGLHSANFCTNSIEHFVCYALLYPSPNRVARLVRD